MKNINDQLSEFTGSEHVYFHPFGFVYTEGIQYLAKTFGCYWLLDDIFIYAKSKSALQGENFQIWNLRRITKTNAFTLTAEDGNYNVLFTTKIKYSDFIGDQVTIWFISGTMLLPSEY